jgi:hypothetical protein
MNEVPNSGGRKFAPELSSFQKLYKKGQSQVVWARLVADLETPVSAFFKVNRAVPAKQLSIRKC